MNATKTPESIKMFDFERSLVGSICGDVTGAEAKLAATETNSPIRFGTKRKMFSCDIPAVCGHAPDQKEILNEKEKRKFAGRPPGSEGQLPLLMGSEPEMDVHASVL